MGNKRNIKLITVLLIMAMVLGVCPTPLLAQAFSDTGGHWAEEAVNLWTARGIVKGYEDGTFGPDRLITRAEFAALLNRTFGFTTLSSREFPDVGDDAWYAGDVSKAAGAGYMQGYEDESFRPDNYITRQEAALVFARIYNLEQTDESYDFTDFDSIPDWSRWAVVAVAKAGLMQGYPDRSFGPTRNITRAETVTVLDRLVAEIFTEGGIYGDTDEKTVIDGNAIITAADVTLVNMHIKGNLLIAESVGEGTVVLEDVVIDGELDVSGGGSESVILDSSAVVTLTVSKEGVRIVIRGSKVDEARVKAPSTIEQDPDGEGIETLIIEELPADGQVVLSGDFGNLSIKAEAGKVIVEGGHVDEVIVDETATDVEVVLGSGSSVSNLILDAPATVSGSGKIEKATVNASGAVIEPEPEEVELGEDVSAIIGGEEVVYVPEEEVPGAPPEPEPRVPVTGVTLDKQTLELTVGDAETISATVKPASATNKRVTWSTSDAAVVTVSAVGRTATVTAVGAGTATVTVTTQDGGFTASCEVTVIELPGAFGKNAVTTKKHGAVDGYIVDIRLTDGVTFSGAQVEVSLVDADGNVMQKNTLKEGHDITGTSLTCPFDVRGNYDYESDRYWNVEGSVYGKYETPAKAVIRVVLANGKELTDELAAIKGVYFEGGSGTEEAPYLIKTFAQLKALQDLPVPEQENTVYYVKLISDIEIEEWVQIPCYDLVMDLDGHTIFCYVNGGNLTFGASPYTRQANYTIKNGSFVQKWASQMLSFINVGTVNIEDCYFYSEMEWEVNKNCNPVAVVAAYYSAQDGKEMTYNIKDCHFNETLFSVADRYDASAKIDVNMTNVVFAGAEKADGTYEYGRYSQPAFRYGEDGSTTRRTYGEIALNDVKFFVKPTNTWGYKYNRYAVSINTGSNAPHETTLRISGVEYDAVSGTMGMGDQVPMGFVYAPNGNYSFVEITESGRNSYRIDGKPVDYKGTQLPEAYNKTNDIPYYSLQEAINEASAGDVIALAADIRLMAQGITVGSDKEITLDLAGYVLSGVLNNTGSSALITNNGELTITDTSADKTGKITNQALNPDTTWEPGFPAYANNTITNHGQLTIEGGRIENTTSGGASYVIDNNSTIRDAVVVIDGGYIVNPNNNFAIRQFANSTKNKNSITINDGVVEGTRAVWIQLPGSSGQEKLAELTVNGGTLRSTDKDGYNLAVYSYTFGDSFAATKITINGGIFDGDIALTGGNSKVPTETVQVTGGYFKGGYGVYSYGEMGGFITGGYFNTEATAYLAPGYTFVESDEPGYKCMVVQGEGRIVNLTQKKAYETIQDAVTAATPGDTILATAGTYEVEQIKITKRLTLMGVGDESVIQATTNKAVLVTEADGITIKDLKLVGAEEPGAGIKIGSKVAIDGLTIDNCTIEGFTNGIYADSNSADEPVVKNVLIRNTRFIGNSLKGIYVEKLSESTIENCYFEGNGYDHYAGAGIDINAKFADYKDITMRGCTFVENGVASDHGGGILVKARGTGNDDAYSSNPATLTNVTIEDCTFENNKNAIVLGEYGKNNTGPTNVVITGSTYINNGQDVVDYRKLDEGAPEEAGNTFLNSDVLDIPPLDNAIEAARAVKEGIAVSQDGVDVPAGTYWVTPENMEALDEAIAAAEAAKATVRTQQEVAEAVEELEAAVSAFNEAKQPAIGEEEAEMLDEGEGPSEAEKPAEGEEPVQSGQPEE